MIRKIFRLKSSHNLLPAHKSKYDLATPSNCVACEMPFIEHHLLIKYKNLLLGEGDTPMEAALKVRYILCEFLSLSDIQDMNTNQPYTGLTVKRYI